MQISISIILLVSILSQTYGNMSVEEYILSNNTCITAGTCTCGSIVSHGTNIAIWVRIFHSEFTFTSLQ